MASILVIEDEQFIRNNLIELLSSEGYDTFGAGNGREGIIEIQKHTPDLILCDIMMPEIDGYGVLEYLRKNPNTAMIPIIFLTAKVDKSDMRLGMGLGADDYITKPYNDDELIKTVKTRLEKHNLIKKQVDEVRDSIAFSLPHEFRTPLTTILGYSDIIMSEAEKLETNQIIDLSRNIYLAGERLLKLTEKFLLFTKLMLISRDNTALDESKNKYIDLPSHTVKRISAEIAGKNNRLEDLEIDCEDTKVAILLDYFEIIISELVENAIKFSYPGSKIIIASAIAVDDYILNFIDYGRGMTEEQINNIGAFTQFERQKFEQQGIGMGLITIKLILQLFNGNLEIKSIPGKETIVKIKLPLFKQNN